MKQLRSNRLGLLCLSFLLCLGVGVGLSSANGEVSKVRAVDTPIYTLDTGSTTIATSDTYSNATESKSGYNWTITLGNKQNNGGLWLGSNNKQKAKMILSNGSYSEATKIATAIGTTTSATYYAALFQKSGATKISNIDEINLSFDGTGGTAPSGIWIVYSTDDGSTWNIFGSKKTSVSTGDDGNSFINSTAVGSAIYGLVIYSTNYCQFKVPVLKFYEASNPDAHSITITSEVNNIELKEDNTLTMTATCPQGDTAKWSSGDTNVATIDETTGVLTPVGAGSVVITATCSSDSTATATKTITVWKEPDVITGKTVAEVAALATKEDKTTLYEVTGFMSSWYNTNTNGTAYGNFYIKDLNTTADASLYVYGSTAEASALTYDYLSESYSFDNPRTFLENDITGKIGTTLGYRITIKGFITKVTTNVFALRGIVTNLEEPVEFSSMSVEVSSSAKTVYHLQDEFDMTGFTIKVSDADGSNVRVLTTDNFTYTPSKFTEIVDKVTITGTGLYDGLSATIDVTVKDIGFDILPSGDDIEVELDNESITYSVGNLKGFDADTLMYEWTLSTDGVVELSSDNTSSTVISFKSVGTTTISIMLLDDSDNELTKCFKVTVNAVKTKFELVKNNLTDFTGEYIIAYTRNNICGAFNGTTDSSNYFQVTLTDNIATATNENQLITISLIKNGSGYLLKINGGTNDGEYLNYSKKSKGISIGETGDVNTILVKNGVATIKNSGGAIFEGNNSSTTPAFKYFTSGQVSPSLYKKIDKTANADAITYAQLFNNEIGCDITGTSAPTGWNTVKTAWGDGTISSEAQIILRNVDVTTETNEDIKKCVATYEYIIAKYNKIDSSTYNDFMGRNVVTSSSNVINKINSNSNSVVLVTIIISCLGIATLGGALLLKKRKENY